MISPFYIVKRAIMISEAYKTIWMLVIFEDWLPILSSFFFAISYVVNQRYLEFKDWSLCDNSLEIRIYIAILLD